MVKNPKFGNTITQMIYGFRQSCPFLFIGKAVAPSIKRVIRSGQ